MKQLNLMLIFIGIGINISQAHETDKAYFKVEQKQETVEISAEFPWTIRNAFLLFNPALERATTQEEFDVAFAEYIRKNLMLTNVSGHQLELQEVKIIPLDGHTHQSSYLITFKGSSLGKVTNTIMFNLAETQENIHTFYLEEERRFFKTSVNSPAFNLFTQAKVNSWLWVLILLPAGWVLYFYRKRRWQSAGEGENRTFLNPDSTGIVFEKIF